MKKLYYTIWSDAIHQLQGNWKTRDNWKFYALFVFSFVNGFNLISLIFPFHIKGNFKITRHARNCFYVGFIESYY
jgi:hypothetical protein